MPATATAAEPTVVSLCTGYGGLELGLAMAGVKARLVFVADPDPAASKLLQLRYPGVANLGDISQVDWKITAELLGYDIDILLAGYPCQGESLAGKRQGEDDDRWIWPDVANAIRYLRPRHVFLENVPGHRSMGFGRVLADLAGLGYVGSWRSISASEIGAAHKRERLFIYAYPADAESLGHGDAGAAQLAQLPAPTVGRGTPALLPTPAARLGISNGITPGAAAARQQNRDGKGLNLDDVIALLPTPNSSHGRRDSRTGPLLGGIDQLLPTPTATDGNRANSHYPEQHATLPDAVAQLLPTPTATRYGTNQSPTPGAAVRPGLDQIEVLLPTPRASANENRSTKRTPSQEAGRHGLYLSAEVCELMPTPRATDGTKGGPNQRGKDGDLMLPSAVQPGRWGAYGPAIERWEAVIGRPAPEPTEPGKTTAVRLAAGFVEWLMGLAEGWVTGVEGLTRNELLRLLGNGVMPPQFAYAVVELYGDRVRRERQR